MFLRRLYIKNLRGISELDLSFAYEGPTDLDAESSSCRQLEGDARKWTLILGENGCGKSTVLRAVALILAGSDALAELLQEPDTWIREGCHDCEIAVDFSTKKNEVAPCVFGDLARSETEGDFQPKPEVHGCAGRGARGRSAKLHGLWIRRVATIGRWTENAADIQSVPQFPSAGSWDVTFE